MGKCAGQDTIANWRGEGREGARRADKLCKKTQVQTSKRQEKRREGASCN